MITFCCLKDSVCFEAEFVMFRKWSSMCHCASLQRLCYGTDKGIKATSTV